MEAHGTSAAWGETDLYHNEFIFTAYGSGWHLSRPAFDAWLASEAANLGVDVRKKTRLVQEEEQSDGWLLTLENASEGARFRTEEQAKFVVDATGRRAVFARRRGAKRQADDHLVGIYRFYSTTQNGPVNTSTLVEAAEDGWWYSAFLPDGRLVTALMTDADIARRLRLRDEVPWAQQVERTVHTRQRLAGLEAGPPILVAASSQLLEPVADESWLAVGDAASSYDPLSSLGIFKALRTGIFGSYAILDRFRGEPRGLLKYRGLVGAEYRSYLEKRSEYYGLEKRFPGSIFWQRRQPAGSKLP